MDRMASSSQSVQKDHIRQLQDAFKDELVFVLASGPSLTQEDAQTAKQCGRVIVVNNTLEMVPDADALFAGDRRWWQVNKDLWKNFDGYKVTKENRNRNSKNDDIYTVPYKPDGTFSKQHIIFGGNSGQGALTLAYVMGARKIVMLGFDMSVKNGTHWHGDHQETTNPNSRRANHWRNHIEKLDKNSKVDIDIINASRYTELNAFKQQTLEEVLEEERGNL